MAISARTVLVSLVAAGSFVIGCNADHASSRTAHRTDSVAAPHQHPTASEQATHEDGNVGDPAPAPAAPKQNTSKPMQLPALPFQLPTLPANLRLPFPLPAGLPTAPQQGPAVPKVPAPPQPVNANRVTVFGIQGCGACSSLKSKLAARNVPFQYVDVDSMKRESVPREIAGKVPKTRVIGKNGAVTWVEGDDADKVERAFRG